MCVCVCGGGGGGVGVALEIIKQNFTFGTEIFSGLYAIQSTYDEQANQWSNTRVGCV